MSEKERRDGRVPAVPLVFIVVLAVLGMLLHPVLLFLEQQRDPDRDGIPTFRDPHPDEFDADLDADGDGWTNGFELLTGSRLDDPDQDHDSLPDGYDLDGDGMNNWFERNIAGLDPARKNDRFYLQLSSFPLPELDEGWNRRYWVELQGLPESNYIVRYSITRTEFMEIIRMLEERSDNESLVFFFLKTHGAVQGTGEPILCFANASYPGRADICGEYLSYRELDAMLDRIPCKYMLLAYTSCAGGSALPYLEDGGACPRVTLSLMGSALQPPAAHARALALQDPNGYFDLADYIALLGNNSARDPEGIAADIYPGDMPNVLLGLEEG